MTRTMVTAGFAGLVLAATMMCAAHPASADVSDAVRKACEKKADQVEPPLRAPDREAFIAGCLADATAKGNN